MLLYSDNKHACSLFPQVCYCIQTINVPVYCFLRYTVVLRWWMCLFIVFSGILLYSDDECACSLFSQVVPLVTWTLTISLLFIWPHYEYTPQPNLVLAAVYFFFMFITILEFNVGWWMKGHHSFHLHHNISYLIFCLPFPAFLILSITWLNHLCLGCPVVFYPVNLILL